MTNSKRVPIATILLTLAACHSNRNEIVDKVCKPINADAKASFEKLVADNGFNSEEAQSICHQYVVDQREKIAAYLRGN